MLRLSSSSPVFSFPLSVEEIDTRGSHIECDLVVIPPIQLPRERKEKVWFRYYLTAVSYSSLIYEIEWIVVIVSKI